MYHVSDQGVDERMINVHYYYYCYYDDDDDDDYYIIIIIIITTSCRSLMDEHRFNEALRYIKELNQSQLLWSKGSCFNKTATVLRDSPSPCPSRKAERAGTLDS